MIVHLVDGTYELFRHYFGAPPRQDTEGREVGAVIGVANSILMMLRDGATHIGVATDHVVESFRNDLYDGYKTGEGMDEELYAQFHPLEDVLEAMGVTVWRMKEYEADDGLAAAAARAAKLDAVHKVVICTPDKDLGQCVVGDRVVQYDRRHKVMRNEDGVREKFGVNPASIPDYLALVGDAADGFPGLPGWGAKSTSTVLGRFEHLEKIPHDWKEWGMKVRGGAKLAQSLVERWDDALLFRDLATLREDAPTFEDLDELRWKGPADDFEAVCTRLDDGGLVQRARSLARQIS